MSNNVIYPPIGAFHNRLAILTIREHLCGFYQLKSDCADTGVQVDSDTGHTLCLACQRITVKSGLRECDICGREYIDKTKHQDANYETNCPRCVTEYGL